VEPPFGFSPKGAIASPWLPQPDSWGALTVESQATEPDSMLALYRRALAIRRGHKALGDGALTWVDGPAGVLSFARDPGFRCVVNLAAEPAQLPEGAVLLASGPLADDGRLPPDAAVWIAR
jgi:alpha-glucosidase